MKLSEDWIGRTDLPQLKTKSLQHVTSAPEIPYYIPYRRCNTLATRR